MKRLNLSLWIVAGLTLGLVLSGLVQTNTGCGLVPTTQQADNLVATLKADTAQTSNSLSQLKAAAASQPSVTELQAELKTVQAVATTQPSNADLKAQVDALNKQIAATNTLQAQIATLTTVLANVQKGVNVAAGVDQAVYHGDPSQLVAATAPLIPAPYNLLLSAAVPLIWGIWQNRKASTAQQAHTDAVAANDASTAALQQFAQATHSIAPDAVVAQINSTVDSSTRAAVAAAGVVHVQDAPAPAAPAAVMAAVAQPALQSIYPLPLSATNGAGK